MRAAALCAVVALAATVASEDFDGSAGGAGGASLLAAPLIKPRFDVELGGTVWLAS
eukprot:COSAG06_NODE_42401_length_382_cov_0.554770_1_plen_56_part_00